MLAGGQRFTAVKALLAGCPLSDYFKALVLSGMQESMYIEIELKELSPTAVRAILEFCTA